MIEKKVFGDDEDAMVSSSLIAANDLTRLGGVAHVIYAFNVLL